MTSKHSGGREGGMEERGKGEDKVQEEEEMMMIMMITNLVHD
jgi:hypothetical protein